MRIRSIIEATAVVVLSLAVGGVAFAQVITTGAPIWDWDCSATGVTSCPGATTSCPKTANDGDPCHYCVGPLTQRRCKEVDPVTGVYCQETTWGPNNGCGTQWDGTCLDGIYGQPCQGPFLSPGSCSRLDCYEHL